MYSESTLEEIKNRFQLLGIKNLIDMCHMGHLNQNDLSWAPSYQFWLKSFIGARRVNKYLFAEYGKKFMKMMFDKDIKVMTLKGHSSHWAQPLDKNPFNSFKTEFNFQMKQFNRSVGGRAIKKDEFFPVFNLAWNKSMTKENIQAGFKRTGIWPPPQPSCNP